MTYFLALAGIAATVVALTLASLQLGVFAIACYALGLLLLVIDAALLLAARQWRYGFSVLTVALGLFAVSLLPLYEHVSEPGMGKHRHFIWQFYHVH